jgi:hypothetical protein
MQLNTYTRKNNSHLVQLMDKYLWNEQTEVVDALFPDAEQTHPQAARWYELKDSTPAHIEQLTSRGAAVLRFGTHAWLGLPDDFEAMSQQLQQRGMSH